MAGKVDLKVVLLGKEYGGKTSLVERYIHGKFNSNAPYQSVSLRCCKGAVSLCLGKDKHCRKNESCIKSVMGIG